MRIKTINFTKSMMADELEQQEIEENNTVKITHEEKDQQKKIRKEIEMLQFYLEDIDELLESEDFNEIKQRLQANTADSR